MSTETLTPDRILEAAEGVLRRYGPAKANVVDVARALGLSRSEFAIPDPVAGARAVFDATARYHNPAHAAAWSDPDIDTSYENVRALVLAGLTPKRPQGSA